MSISATKNISAGQFGFFRIIFGIYLLQHFLYLLPWGAELFSNAGVLADPTLNPTHGLLPNPLATTWGGTPLFVTSFLAALTLLSLAFTLGVWRRWGAFLLWFGWACLFDRNNLISNPSLPYVGVVLLFCVLIPDGEAFSIGGNKRSAARDWFFPAWVFRGAWWLMVAGYTFSGVIKLGSPSWVDGTAFHHLIDNPLSRPGVIRDGFLALPAWAIAIFSWSVLAAEITFLPLSIWKWGRMLAWLGMMGMHLGIVLVVDFADLSFGMIMIHLFTFDPDWLPVRRDDRQPVLLYDGECGLCNTVVRFLLREDASGRLRFAPLQSAPAQEFLRSKGLPTEDFDSLVLIPDWGRKETGAFHLKTNGALAAFAEIGGFMRVLSGFRALPVLLRDACYRLVARGRYRLFGVYIPTPLDNPEWEKRFLAR